MQPAYAVYDFGTMQEKKLSNFAFLSPALATVPYARLGRFQKRSKDPLHFCWQQHAVVG